ncbi:MAG: hypothetical protein AAFY56_04140 [Pseudomonadota bacterium]
MRHLYGSFPVINSLQFEFPVLPALRLSLVVALLGLAACATLPNEERHREVLISPEASTLKLPADRFDPQDTQHGLASNRLTGSIIESASFRDEDAFLVVQFRRGDVGPSFAQRPLEAMLREWTDEAELEPHAAENREEQDGVEIALSTFGVEAWDAECLGFREAGALLSSAPAGERGGVLFGVYCRDSQVALSLDSAEELLLSIRLRRPPLPQPKPPVTPPAQAGELFACQSCEPGA